MTQGPALVELDTAAELGVRNSQPEGIGRVVALEGGACWNNLGRNVVFADRTLRPRAACVTTLHPGEDEPSQYDLDVHAVLEAPDRGLVMVLNHFGTVRCFRRADVVGPGALRAVEPVALWSFVGDVERAVVAAGRLIASRPRSEGATGVLVSAPVPAADGDGRIATQLCAAELGEVTALATVPSPDGPLIAVGGDGRLALAPLVGDRLAPPRWEAPVSFRVASLAWHAGTLWAAGPARVGALDDYDWEQLRGGGFALLDADGAPLASGPLPDDVAWGTGGTAVAVLGAKLVVACRTGNLHVIDPRHPARARSTPPLADGSLGIAHLALVGSRAVWGFNRGGYRLHAYGPLAARTA